MKKYVPLFLLFFALLLPSCRRSQPRPVIGVSQCSSDVWRDKLNRELRTAGYFNDVEVEISSAGDDNAKQITQINRFIDRGVNLLVISPNQYRAIAPVVERAYDKGIPVILFDRKVDTPKYTAYIGVDNYEVGREMGQLIAAQLKGRGVVAEIAGQREASSAQERHRGFMSVISRYPDIRLVALEYGDWTEPSGVAAMKRIVSTTGARPLDYIFAQNDRMARGAYRVMRQHGDAYARTRMTGVDALAYPGGGLDMVDSGILTASYIYPTEGSELLALAMRILRHQPYRRNNLFRSSIATKANTGLLAMQQNDLNRMSDQVEILHRQANAYLERVSMQRTVLVLVLVAVVLLAAVLVLGYRMFLGRARMQEERERLKDSQLSFFTNVSHQIRTPLTLIADPIHRMVERGSLAADDLETLRATDRNARQLMELVDNILDFNAASFDAAGNRTDAVAERVADDNVPPDTGRTPDDDLPLDDGRPTILVVDDNSDIRAYVRTVLKDHFHVLLARDGRQGLTIAREKEPDIIISDIMMPRMDGLEMTRRLKADVAVSHIPVVLLTAKSRDEQIAEGYEAGASAYLTKPFSSQVLLARVRRISEEQRLIQQDIARRLRQNTADALPQPAAGEAKVSPRDRDFLDRLRTIIDKSMADSSLNVETIGQQMCLSRVQLYRKVKSLTGSSPVELVRKMRLDRARRLLATTGLTVSEVAYDVGFSTPSYFTKCYKDEFGELPTDGRR